MSLLFDSTVLIAHLRGVAPATELLVAAVRSGRALASVVSRIEIEGGMRSSERGDVGVMFAGLDMVAVSDPIAGRAAEMMRRHRRSHVGIDLADYVIAATAQIRDAELMTLNVKHFPMIDSLRPAF